MSQSTIVWFRKDLRLDDNLAFIHAAKQGTIIPVYILAEHEEDMPIGAASKWWLHHSLLALKDKLAHLDIPLIIRAGNSKQLLGELLEETGATAIYFNKRYEPAIRQRDQEIIEAFQATGIDVQVFESDLLFKPGTVTNQQGTVYKIFTPFWKQARKQHVNPPKRIPPQIKSSVPETIPIGEVATLKLLPHHPWINKLQHDWKPGEAYAHRQWHHFLDRAIDYYDQERDYPAKTGVSKLSPYLAWGEISPRKIWYDSKDKLEQLMINQQVGAHAAIESFMRQLVWREFAYHQLVAFPKVIDQPLKPEFTGFSWLEDKQGLQQWRQARTGYPLVDAGMRELWETGWMHNRIRMITASFLVKHLLIHWQEGAAWFRDTLVDHDLANNTMGWQWVAGSGYDAAPYFRIFNPMTQGEKYDPDGDYVRKWIPEIANLPTKYLFAPWKAPKEVLEQANIVLGDTYPEPIVDHKASRTRALARYQDMKEEKK